MGELTDPQVAYKPVHKNPMDKNRSPTDTTYLYIFVVLLAAWFIMNCTYLFQGNTIDSVIHKDFFIKITNAQTQTIITLPEIFHQRGAGFIAWIAIAGTLVFLLFLKTLNCLPKFWAVVGLILAALLVVVLTVNIFTSLFLLSTLPNDSPTLIIIFIFNIVKQILIITFIVASIHATCTVKVSGLAEIIQKTSDAVFFFPTLFIFGFVIMLLSLTVIAFTAVSLYSMDNVVTGILSFLGGIYLISIIYNFGAIVISQCISTWYCSQNKEELSGCLILKSVGLVGRNHIGSVVFNSTLILPIILSLYVLCTNKFPSPPNSGFKALLVKFALILYASEYALILTASHGIGVHEAMKKVYSLFTRSCVIVLSFCCVFGSILIVFLIFAMLISMCLALVLFQDVLLENKDYANAAGAYYNLGVYLFIAVFVTATVTSSTVLVNTAEEIEENEEREMIQIQGNV